MSRPRLPLLVPSILAIAGLVAAPAAAERSAADRLRDASRRPAEVIAFLGVEPGMTVLDVIAAGGWYTEVLSEAVGEKGRVYAQNPEVVLKFRDGANDKALTARLAAGRLQNVIRLDGDLSEVAIPDGSVDVALTALNFHDVYNGRGEEAALAFLNTIHAKLVPGGVLGIIDHDGSPGNDNEKLHRIEKAKVLALIEKSAFTLDGESHVLANEADDHSQNVFAPEIRGNTDRFVLKLKKAPGSPRSD